ncbi:LAMI_0C08878g1_1 [Lachancea mirantina]|uniref:pyridoxal kinase n=1 Tax=Lachancea mirantina TaxID=1230905 RepID=A0A1G4J5I7_9SACH|nr:LAMI_0C08878g1_1 [Lachancea mirantina]
MPRLLATQSHVVHGYVGNKAATFPLQCLGWDVDCVNSVQFSNHTGYGADLIFGSIASEKDLELLLTGVSDFDDYDALLSGYLPTDAAVSTMGRFYTQMKQKNASVIWLLDPVMGDDGQLYVNENVVPIYRALVSSSLVDVMTPNHFELELLYGSNISNKNELKSALAHFHKTVPAIVVTSCSRDLFEDGSHIYCVASLRGTRPVVFRIPVIDSYFTGVGDMFSALLLDRLYRMFEAGRRTFAEEVNHVLNVLHNVLELTLKHSPKNVKAVMGQPKEMKQMELRTIESRDLYDRKSSAHNFIYKPL